MATSPESGALTLGSAAWSFLAALGGAAIPLSVMWVKLQLDQLSARCDAFAKAVEGAMDLALEYWLTGVPAGGKPVAAETDAGKIRDAAILKHEIRLRGAQAALQADVERMVIDLPPRFRAPLRAEFQNVIDALTGDPFGDRSGHTEADKAMAAMSSGTRLVRIVREGRDEVSRFKNMLRYVSGLSSRTDALVTVKFGAAIYPPVLFQWVPLTLAIIILVGAAGFVYTFLARAPEPQLQQFKPYPELVDSTCEVWLALPADQRGKTPEKCVTPPAPGSKRSP